jgi:hypothetical protein
MLRHLGGPINMSIKALTHQELPLKDVFPGPLAVLSDIAILPRTPLLLASPPNRPPDLDLVLLASCLLSIAHCQTTE